MVSMKSLMLTVMIIVRNLQNLLLLVNRLSQLKRDMTALIIITLDAMADAIVVAIADATITSNRVIPVRLSFTLMIFFEGSN